MEEALDTSTKEVATIRSHWAQHNVKVLKEGEAFGELGLLKPMSAAEATLRASADNLNNQCTLYFLPMAAFVELIDEAPGLKAAVERSHGHSALSTCLFLVRSDLLKKSLSTDIPIDLVQELAGKLKPMLCSDGQVLIKKGQPAVGLFLVRKGEAHCFIDDPAEPSQLKLVKKIGAGGHFGELSIIEPGRVTAAHVHAIGPATEVLLLTAVRYEEICSRFADFRQMLLASTPQYASFNFFLTSRLLKGGASHELVQAMSKAASLESFVAGATVLKAGEKPKSVYFVQRGRLRKVTPAKDDNGDDDEVELKVGDHFGYDPSEEGSSEDAPAIAEVVQADAMETGEEAKAEGASTSGTTINSPEVTSLTDCLLLAISSSSFDEVLKAHPQLAGLMMQAKVAEAAEAASFKRRDAANGGAPGGAPAMSGAMSGGMAVNPLVESQLVHLQRSLDEVTGRIGSLEMEINRCRAAQERQESTEKANTERIMLKLHEISSKAGGSQGPGMPSGLNQMMSSAGFGQQGGGPRRRSLTNDNIGTM